MDIKPFFRKYGAYLVAAVVFIAAAVIYCFPETQGKVVYAGDGTSAEAAVHESVEYTRETGDYSWWNAAMFSGMPNYQIGGGRYQSSRWLRPLKLILHRGHSHTIWIFIIYLFCFFILLRSFDIDKWLSIVGAFAIALSSYFIVIIAAGHNSKTSTIALMSVVLAGFHLIFRKKYGLGVILAMVFTACGFSTHPQMSYYIFMLIGLLWLMELWIHIREKRMRDFLVASLLFFCAVGIGIGTNMSNVFANAEYAQETMRGGHSDLQQENGQAESKGLDIAYATQWSYGADEAFSFLIPGFMGGTSAGSLDKDSHLYKALIAHGTGVRNARDLCSALPLYWGEQPFTAGNVYMGAIVCFLFLLGLLIVEGPYKWGLLAATLFSVALALGHNCMWLTELFFRYFPLYNKFRAVSSILIVAEIAMPLLGFLAIKALMDGSVSRDKAARSILISGGITGSLCLLLFLLGGSLFSFTSTQDAQLVQQVPDWFYQALLDDRAKLQRSDSLRSLLFILGAAALLWLYAKDKLKAGWMIAALGVLVVLDMWPVDKRYFNDGNFVPEKTSNAAFEIQPYEQALLQQPGYFRVFNLTSNPFNDARTSYRLKSVGGYHAAKLRRYQDLIDKHLAELHMPVIGMLNARYLISNGKDGKPSISENPYALGNAWFVSDLIEVEDANGEIDSLMSIDLRTQAVIDKSFVPMAANLHPGIPEGSYVTLMDHTPKSLDYEVFASAPGTVVFSEIYYPHGWKATLDGQNVDHYRVNYMLRAMDVPAGSHHIHFVFDPDSVRKGDTIAVIFCALMYLLVLGIIAAAVWRRFKKA
ncbi:MAG: hypothetical protein IJ654_08205 [Bacteroidales bacterium]|nr:hypothetical protein [Bacteroidales bacterium]